MNKNKLSRREMLKLTGLGSAGLILAACAMPTEAPKPTQAPLPTPTSLPKKPIKVTMVESWFAVPQYKESIDPINKVISEKAQSEGVPIQLESMILEDHATKYPLLYAAGADFTMAFDAPWYNMTALRTQGAIAALEDRIVKYPNLMAEITEKIYKANLIDGHMWGIPAAGEYNFSRGVLYRRDLARKYGAPDPTSKDGLVSFVPFLEAIVKNEPQLIPLANITDALWNLHRFHHQWGYGPGLWVEDITKGFQITNVEDSQWSIDQARLVRSWWEKGYINKTDVTSTEFQKVMSDYLFPGRAASCVQNGPDFSWFRWNKEMKAAIPDADLYGVEMQGIMAGVARGIGMLRQWNFIVFNVKAPREAQDTGLQFFDWLTSSQDNLDLWLMGIDGVNYKKEPNMRFSEIEGVDPVRNYRRAWYVGGVGGRFTRQPADLPKELDAILKAWYTESFWDFHPYEQFEPDYKALEVEGAKLNAVYAEATHGFFSGQIPVEESIPKMKKMLDDAGRQVYREKIQKMLDDYIAKHK
jgi:putative aldouronate transport system substrate-binding protein